MKEYLLRFWNEAGDGSYQPSAEELKQGMAAWQAWIGEIAVQGKLVSTKPIQFSGSIVNNSGIESHPAIVDGMMVTGYLICKADAVEELENWSKTCPILHYPKGFTEIREMAPFEI